MIHEIYRKTSLTQDIYFVLLQYCQEMIDKYKTMKYKQKMYVHTVQQK